MSEEQQQASTLVGTVELFSNVEPVEGEHHRVPGRRPRNSPPNTPPPLVDVIRLPQLVEDDEVLSKLSRILGGGSEEDGNNILKSYIRTVITEAAEEASDEAFDGETFNPVKFETEFAGFFLPASRRKRAMKREEIRKRKDELVQELEQIILETMNNAGRMTDESQNRFLAIQQELAELAELESKRQRRGKKPAPVSA